jgi:hypothetical protein
VRRGGESFAHADEVQRLVRRGVLPGVQRNGAQHQPRTNRVRAQQNGKPETRIKVGLRDFERESEMTKARKRKHVGALPITGSAACWRSVDIKLPCVTCGGRSAPVHSPTRLAGIFCGEHCPCCNAAAEASAAQSAATPLPDADSAVLASPGARGGGFNNPFRRRYDKYLGR